MPPQGGHLCSYHGQYGQVDEPDEVAGPEVQVEAGFLFATLQSKRLAHLEQEPDHDGDTESQDEVARPRLPLVYV